MSEQLAYLLDRLGRAVHSLQFARGLNPAQWEALRFIARANRYTCKPTALAEYLGTTKGTVSQTLNCLEDKGLIRRVSELADRRAVRLELTDAGTAVLQHDPLRPLEAVASEMNDDLSDAVQVLSKYVRRLQGRCGMKSFGICEECGHFVESACDKGRDFTCGLTGEPLSCDEVKQICGSYRACSE
jgi:DNA-binding MarR family transcriptional regulator